MCAKKWEEKVFETLGNGTDGGRFPTRESSHDQAAPNLQVLPTWYIWIEKILREEELPTWYIWIEKNLGEETPIDNEDQIIVKSNIWTKAGKSDFWKSISKAAAQGAFIRLLHSFAASDVLNG